ncbi:phage tail assembly protein [Hoeflea sp.]|uniref:phage tail assembly protein n=1 Tax=Hoeflea sp. TaxID=1940281 RepID=UPI003B522E74
MTTENTEVQPAEKPAAKFLSAKPREKTVTLDHPFEYDGVEVTTITIRRTTGKEINEFLDRVAAASGETVVPPMVQCSLEVWESMDDDDRYKVEMEMVDFFPRRLRDMAPSVLPASEDASVQ